MSTDLKTLRVGDVVRDSITNEKWVLAFVDAENDEVSWCGWPPGAAAQADAVPRDPVTDADLDAIAAAHKRMVAATTSVIQLGRVAVEEVAHTAEDVA